MTAINLKNGNKIEVLESTSIHRGKRSELISFYCANCGIIHEDIPITEMMCISNSFAICKTSYDEILKPYLNIEN